ncbi:MAG: hypothetical protein WDN06_21690 [Asticcacaulis sp.]
MNENETLSRPTPSVPLPWRAHMPAQALGFSPVHASLSDGSAGREIATPELRELWGREPLIVRQRRPDPQPPVRQSPALRSRSFRRPRTVRLRPARRSSARLRRPGWRWPAATKNPKRRRARGASCLPLSPTCAKR